MILAIRDSNVKAAWYYSYWYIICSDRRRVFLLEHATTQRRNNTMAIKFARRLITVSAAALGAYILLFRPWQHRWVATEEDDKRTLRGDELRRHPDENLTHAITIRARRAEVW